MIELPALPRESGGGGVGILDGGVGGSDGGNRGGFKIPNEN